MVETQERRTVGPAITLLLLSLCPPVTLLAQSAQPITVIAAPGFRARAVQQHQFGFEVAFDSAAGGLLLRNLALGAFTFTGSVRIDGISPFARTPERPGYADSARFESDGRAVLLVADSGRGPITVEPRGIPGVNAGRLLISAERWPANRVVSVTIEPLDLFTTETRAGYTVRDRIRVEDPGGIAYVSDSTSPPAVIAVALWRANGGRLQSGQAEVVIRRTFEDGAVVPERRRVNRLVLFLEPDATASGGMQAEVLFGLGRSEAEAVRAARDGALAVPPAVALPRMTTPEPDVAMTLRHLLATAAWAPPPRRPPAVDTAWADDGSVWRDLLADARRFIAREYGRPDSVVHVAERFRARLIRGLFGVETRGEGIVTVAPRVAGVADDFTWRFEGYRFASDSLAYSYRPADRRVVISVVAARRVRLELKFPWLEGGSCVQVRREGWPVERLPMVMMRDGWFYTDVRPGQDPATVTVSAAACGT